jgi:hypothetical protein
VPCLFKVFATCSRNDIRVWNARTCIELLRIQVPNLTCNCIVFSNDGLPSHPIPSDGRPIRSLTEIANSRLACAQSVHRGLLALAVAIAKAVRVSKPVTDSVYPCGLPNRAHCTALRVSSATGLLGLFALRREAATVLMDNSNAVAHAWVSNR